MHNLVIFQCFSEQVYYKKKFGSFLVNFQFRAEVKKVTSRAELKNLQLELWLEPARLGLITSKYVLTGENMNTSSENDSPHYAIQA